MEYVTLGRTGLEVSVAGLGCGGFSRLGLGTGKSEAEAVALVHQAFDLGVNLFDTAAVYGTEEVLGKALKGLPRDRVVIATKAWIPRGGAGSAAARAVASLDNSLKLLGIDCIDIFELHGVSPEAYDRAREVIAPALLKEQAKGKIRHLGVTETGSSDAEHRMLQRAVEDGIWDVVMLGFHMMHQNARTAVFPRTIANGVGTLLDVRGAQHLFQAGPAEDRIARAGRPKRSCRAGSTTRPTRWVSLSMSRTAALRTSPRPPIALSGTSRGSMSCCSAPATRSICAPTSPRS